MNEAHSSNFESYNLDGKATNIHNNHETAMCHTKCLLLIPWVEPAQRLA